MVRASRASDDQEIPATISDERIGVNGAIAVTLTRKAGSMRALYTALVLIGAWMALATWGPLRRVDHYPFPFLLFLNNVIQLLLCLVILVGQRLLGGVADRRAVQTYEHAEAIFMQVTDLQRHLDQHDQELSHGVSLLESTPHPWIERHHVQAPPQAADQAVTVNDRIAVWLTRRLGTMGAFYLATGTQVAWIALALAGIQRFDPYPFAFMSFLSTLSQLIFIIVIMVGQDVLSRAADRRSEQTFLDAEAILHECRRMKARLTAQDRIIASLAGYVSVQVIERLARAIHHTYGTVHEADVRAAVASGRAADGTHTLGTWDELPEEFKESNRAQAREIGERLAVVGCLMVPAGEQAASFAFDEEEVWLLARLEHERWVGERTAQGFTFGPVRENGRRPDLVPWDRLTNEARTRNMRTVRRIPAMLAGVGFQVLRDASSGQGSSGDGDFLPGFAPR